jgi:PAS domain S-box-containing protein
MKLEDFTPHGFCLAWDPGLIWLQAGSDLLITAAYYSIPAALLVFLRRRKDLAFRPVFALFAAFILACGTTHLLSVITLWQPVYWLDGAIKAITAALSVATALVLWPLIPRALALPSASDLRALNERLAHEVAERDTAMDLLRQSETRLRQLYARSPAALHATDPHGKLLDVSNRWLDLFGYKRNDVIGRDILSLYAPDDRAAVAAHLSALAAGRGALKSERHILCSSGEIRATENIYELEYDTAGKLQRIQVALTDITARKQAEAALQASEERLRQAQKMEAVGQLTGGIAHDFNNLLTSIMGSLELLQQKGPLEPRAKRLTGNALEGARRAARLTSQLLSFSRRQRLAPESLAPDDVVAGISDLLYRSVGEQIVLSIATPAPDQWPMLADRNQLEVALINLVLNARDAIESSGTIAVSFANRTLQAGDIETTGPEPLAPGDYVSIAVADTGKGMTPQVLARAFEPFFTTKPAGAGTGLGLSQTFGFVTQSGGTVLMSSKPGAGTKVEILLPRSGSPALRSGPPQTRADPALAGQGETILFVEDDALLRETVAEALEHQGYTVISTANGAAALLALEQGGKIDLLFTDVMMPGDLNGVGLARAARAQRPDLKIMFASGYSDRQVLAAWPETLDLIPKPYSLDTLAARIAACLAKAAAGA